MAVTYVEVPSPFPIRSKTFNLRPKQQVTPVGSGFIQTIDRTTPYWVAEYTTPPLSGDRYNALMAWLESLDGASQPFLAFDPRRPMPYAHKFQTVGSNPWHRAGSNPRAVDCDYAASTIDLDTMATGAVVTASDYISLLDGNKWRLFRVTTGGVADASGLLTVTVKPRPLMSFGAAIDIRYQRACAAMKLVGNYEETDDVSSLPVISFQATQFIDRT